MDIAAELGRRFLERRDVKAIQHANGSYEPDRTPWTKADIQAHLDGTRTLGHYLVSPENRCRLFAFDIDLVKGLKEDGDKEWHPLVWDGPDGPTEFFPRDAFLDLDHWARPTLIAQLNLMAEGLARRTARLHDFPVAIAYSGAKGVHVYCFTGSIEAADAKFVAEDVLESFGAFEPSRGRNFWRHTGEGFASLEIEVFPKQENLDGKDLGNLMRLPLGINRKTGQAGTFLRAVPPPSEFVPMNAEAALAGTEPWA